MIIGVGIAFGVFVAGLIVTWLVIDIALKSAYEADKREFEDTITRAKKSHDQAVATHDAALRAATTRRTTV